MLAPPPQLAPWPLHMAPQTGTANGGAAPALLIPPPQVPTHPSRAPAMGPPTEPFNLLHGSNFFPPPPAPVTLALHGGPPVALLMGFLKPIQYIKFPTALAPAPRTLHGAPPLELHGLLPHSAVRDAVVRRGRHRAYPEVAPPRGVRVVLVRRHAVAVLGVEHCGGDERALGDTSASGNSDGNTACPRPRVL